MCTKTSLWTSTIMSVFFLYKKITMHRIRSTTFLLLGSCSGPAKNAGQIKTEKMFAIKIVYKKIPYL